MGPSPEPNSRAHLGTSWGRVKGAKVNKHSGSQGGRDQGGGLGNGDHWGERDVFILLLYIFSVLSNFSKVLKFFLKRKQICP